MLRLRNARVINPAVSNFQLDARGDSHHHLGKILIAFRLNNSPVVNQRVSFCRFGKWLDSRFFLRYKLAVVSFEMLAVHDLLVHAGHAAASQKRRDFEGAVVTANGLFLI